MPPMPPHERFNRQKLFKALCVSTCITGVFAAVLLLLQFPLNVVLPSTAPIWAGMSTVLK